ncbi:MAG: lasso peptide biosynthesis B2 protein [Methylocystis sp.]
MVLRAARTLVVSWVRLRVQGIEEIQAWAARPGNGTLDAKRLAWAIETASRRTPGATCLSKALALQHLLSANGHKSELIIGVDNSLGRFSAHAWLVFDGEILIGGSSVENHRTLASWSTHVASREADQTKQG